MDVKPDWGEAKKLMGAMDFLQQLANYDKDNIKKQTIKKLKKYYDDPRFTPDGVKAVSTAAMCLCMWVRAMHKYHFVALGVAPKRAALATAEAELEVVMGKLKVAQKTLQDVNDKLAGLQKDYDEAVEKLDGLAKKEARCKMQLENADSKIYFIIKYIVLN